VKERNTVRTERMLGLVACVSALGLAATGCAPRLAKVKRVGSVIGIKQENIEEYKRLHADVWPQVLSKLREVNIRNYSIYLAEVEKGRFYLFSYFEYTGDDFKADMARMAADPNTKRWWKHTDPLQAPVPTRKEGEWWATIEEVFHMD
jgi:L-rhamnose mutarotase